MSDKIILNGSLARQQADKSNLIHAEIFDFLDQHIKDLQITQSHYDNENNVWVSYPSDDLLSKEGRIRFYEQHLIRSNIVAMYHLWENCINDCISREIQRIFQYPDRMVFLPLQVKDIVPIFRKLFDIDFTKFFAYPQLIELRTFSNYFKHKNITYLGQIYNRYPQLFLETNLTVYAGAGTGAILVDSIKKYGEFTSAQMDSVILEWEEKEKQKRPETAKKFRHDLCLYPHPDRLIVPFDFAKSLTKSVPEFFQELSNIATKRHFIDIITKEEKLQ